MSFFTRFFGLPPRWARRVAYLELTRNQIERLDAIRRAIGVSDEVFLLQIACDAEATKRLQRFIYGSLKRQTPEMPERLLLARLVRNRLAAARQGGGDLFGLASVPPQQLGTEIRRIVGAQPTIDSMAEAIAADGRSFGGPLSLSARPDFIDAARRVTEILKRTLAVLTVAALLGAPSVSAQSAPSRPTWWLSGQVNVIYQWHPAFRADYTGPNSLRPAREDATSVVATLYSGIRMGRRTEILLDLESAGGGGISQALGLAGFSNLDVVRNPTLGSAPYVGRGLIRYTIPLAAETEPATVGPLSLLPTLPVQRISVALGKLSMADFFDLNSAGSDSHLQYMNWTADNNGAYDYAADTRGYTFGAVIEYRDRDWAVCWGEALMPTVANGIDYDWDVAQAHADNLELELDRGVIPGHAGVVRLLGYVNHANMGSYREAIDAFLGGQDSVLDITAHRRPGRTKAGVGVNVEQGVGHGGTVFARAGVNKGRVESFAYTEVDHTLELGVAWTGLPWRRSDRAGVAFVSNGLEPDHREYLARGGVGFLLGDGRLTYGPERILETYYTFVVLHGLSVAADVQHVVNPGYNRDRGPATILALRAHLDVTPFSW